MPLLLTDDVQLLRRSWTADSIQTRQRAGEGAAAAHTGTVASSAKPIVCREASLFLELGLQDKCLGVSRGRDVDAL
jgi:hypothetical protein